MLTGLDLSQQDGVVHAIVNRGADNLLDGQICATLTRYLNEPPDGAHILVLSARGPVFCLGREREAETPADLRGEIQTLVDLNRALSTSRLLTVAQVHGDAAGFGAGLAGLCDLTIAAPSARFWFPEVEIDLAPAVVLVWLPRLVGYKRALHLTATGRRFSAEEGAAMGLVNRVSATDDALEATVQEEVAGLTKHSARVHAEITAFLQTTADLSEEDAYDHAVEQLIQGSMQRKK